MKFRRVAVISSMLVVAFGAAEGCGGSSDEIPIVDADYGDGGVDVIANDVTTTDATVADASTADTSTVDTAVTDTLLPEDTSTSDTSTTEASTVDGDVADTSTSDTSTTDAEGADTSIADVDVADTSTTGDTSTSDAEADARSPEVTGSACSTAAQCYVELDAQALHGQPYCIDKVTDGYCTHECQDDSDCCAVPGECRTALKQVCAAFENTGKKLCVLSCETADIAAATDAGLNDAGTGDGYCTDHISAEFGCRSTGGGVNNKKACLPTGVTLDAGAPDATSDAPADAPDGD